MPSKQTHRLEVTYCGYDPNLDCTIEKALRRRDSDGSGCGFGERDLAFYGTKAWCEKAADTVRQLRKTVKCPWLKVRIDPLE